MSDNLVAALIAAVADLDPVLLEDPATRPLIEVGATMIGDVTARYGTPDAPRWASGSVETDVLMAYHCGGTDGHTSVGPLGNGVPRGVLLIAAAINSATGREVVDPMLRAATFVAAAAHDHTQLCGRALLPEGQGEHHGDERLSAVTARQRCLDAGAAPAVADLVYRAVMATAFDPETKAQNVDYAAGSQRVVLAQEITAAADLLSLTARRGPLGSVEMVCESLCLRRSDRLVQRRLQLDTSVNSPLWLLDRIDADTELRAAFAEAMAGQAKFFAGHRYSDQRIREVTGAGIDDLFPGRRDNVAQLDSFVGLLADGHSPRELWTAARALAGYRTATTQSPTSPAYTVWAGSSLDSTVVASATPAVDHQFAEIRLERSVLFHGSATGGITELRVAEEDTIGTGVYLTDERAGRGYASHRARHGGTPTLYKVEVDAARLCDLSDEATVAQVMTGFRKTLEREHTDQCSNSGPWYWITTLERLMEMIDTGIATRGQIKHATQQSGELFSKYLAEQGFDGVYAFEGGEGSIGNHPSFVLFDPDKARITEELALDLDSTAHTAAETLLAHRADATVGVDGLAAAVTGSGQSVTAAPDSRSVLAPEASIGEPAPAAAADLGL